MMVKKIIVISLLIYGCFISACQKNKNELIEIPCYRTVVLGDWNVESEVTSFYIQQDSTVLHENQYTMTINDDGTLIQKIVAFNNHLTNYYKWSLQCNPDRFLEIHSGNPALNPNQDPADYVAFTNSFEIRKITTSEIHMYSNYFLGQDDTRREVNQKRIYSRIE